MSGARSFYRRRSSRIIVGACLLAQLVVPGRAPAQVAAAEDVEEPWPPATVAVMRSFFERGHVDEVMLGLRPPDAGTIVGDPIGARATVLGGAPDTLFRFVQRQVAFQAYAGSVLGASGSLRALRGNALDQAMLLVALCRSTGRRAHLVRGRLRWRDAVRLVGPQPDDLASGDPWLRRVEIAADHWWAEVEGPRGWVAMDPSFPDTDPGAVPGVRREIDDEPPRGLLAMARLSIFDQQRDRELARFEMPVAELVGTGAAVTVERSVPEEPADAAIEAGIEAPDDVGPRPATLDPEADAGDDVDQPDALDRYLLELQRPVDTLRLRVGSRERRLPIDDLGPGAVLELRVSVQLPLEEPVELSVAFRPARRTALAVVVESGAVEVGPSALPIYRILQKLSERELEALVAFRERPTEDEEETEEVEEAPPAEPEPAPPEVAEPEGDEEDEPPLHPARALHLAGLEAWEGLDAALPEALGHALLAAGERLRPNVAMERLPVRMVAVRWRPASADAGGEATVWATDEIVLSGLPAGPRRSAEAAFGFLQSAMMGQVLHRVSDEAPLTAFDLTLRSVGTGQRLAWLGQGSPLPDDWPPSATRVADRDRRLGRILVGPRAAPGAVDALGWWSVDPVSGDADGRVIHDGEVASAAVAFGPPVQPADLESVLASLPGLHDAGRWLVQAADARSGALEALLPGACAATTLVSDLLSAGAPRGLALPDFATFCAAAPATGD